MLASSFYFSEISLLLRAGTLLAIMDSCLAQVSTNTRAVLMARRSFRNTRTYKSSAHPIPSPLSLSLSLTTFIPQYSYVQKQCTPHSLSPFSLSLSLSQRSFRNTRTYKSSAHHNFLSPFSPSPSLSLSRSVHSSMFDTRTCCRAASLPARHYIAVGFDLILIFSWFCC